MPGEKAMGHAEERRWFVSRIETVRHDVGVYVPSLYRLMLRVHEIERNADVIVRSQLLAEAVRADPDGLLRLLRRLHRGDAVRNSLRELFAPDTPDGAAIAALMVIGWLDREGEDDADVALARELRERQQECNEIGPTRYVWQVELSGSTVVEVSVTTRDQARLAGFRLIRAVAVTGERG
jgi:hypothetical protein